MATKNARASELLDGLLEDGLGVPCGLRIYAHFLDGVCTDHRLTVFRVPAAHLTNLKVSDLRYDPKRLEEIARELGIHIGVTELIIEYQTGSGLATPRPRWIDFSVNWDVELGAIGG